MAQKNRFSLDIEDIRSRVENLRKEVWWREMALSAKIRSLIIERCEQIEKEQAQLPAPNFKCLLLANHDRLSAHPKLGKRLKKLIDGDEPTETEKLRIALELGVSEDVIDKLLAKGNGHAASI
jgi:hypothetical protein